MPQVVIPGDREIPANPYVPQLAATVEPGTALEVGCGTGNEAIALAEADWEVTAVETSAEALTRAKHRAHGVGPEISWVHADATTWEPSHGYDLVTCSYVHTLLPQPQLLSRLAGWVNPGGRLLMVAHPPETARTTTMAAMSMTMATLRRPPVMPWNPWSQPWILVSGRSPVRSSPAG